MWRSRGLRAALVAAVALDLLGLEHAQKRRENLRGDVQHHVGEGRRARAFVAPRAANRGVLDPLKGFLVKPPIQLFRAPGVKLCPQFLRVPVQVIQDALHRLVGVLLVPEVLNTQASGKEKTNGIYYPLRC